MLTALLEYPDIFQNFVQEIFGSEIYFTAKFMVCICVYMYVLTYIYAVCTQMHAID